MQRYGYIERQDGTRSAPKHFRISGIPEDAQYYDMGDGTRLVFLDSQPQTYQTSTIPAQQQQQSGMNPYAVDAAQQLVQQLAIGQTPEWIEALEAADGDIDIAWSALVAERLADMGHSLTPGWASSDIPPELFGAETDMPRELAAPEPQSAGIMDYIGTAVDTLSRALPVVGQMRALGDVPELYDQMVLEPQRQYSAAREAIAQKYGIDDSGWFGMERAMWEDGFPQSARDELNRVKLEHLVLPMVMGASAPLKSGRFTLRPGSGWVDELSGTHWIPDEQMTRADLIQQQLETPTHLWNKPTPTTTRSVGEYDTSPLGTDTLDDILAMLNKWDDDVRKTEAPPVQPMEGLEGGHTFGKAKPTKRVDRPRKVPAEIVAGSQGAHGVASAWWRKHGMDPVDAITTSGLYRMGIDKGLEGDMLVNWVVSELKGGNIGSRLKNAVIIEMSNQGLANKLANSANLSPTQFGKASRPELQDMLERNFGIEYADDGLTMTSKPNPKQVARTILSMPHMGDDVADEIIRVARDREFPDVRPISTAEIPERELNPLEEMGETKWGREDFTFGGRQGFRYPDDPEGLGERVGEALSDVAKPAIEGIYGAGQAAGRWLDDALQPVKTAVGRGFQGEPGQNMRAITDRPWITWPAVGAGIGGPIALVAAAHDKLQDFDPSTYTKPVPNWDDIEPKLNWKEPLREFYDDRVRMMPYEATRQPRRAIVQRNRDIGMPAPQPTTYTDYRPQIQPDDYQDFLEAMERARTKRIIDGVLHSLDPVTGEWAP